MNILLISDTHGQLDNLRIVSQNEQFDLVLHMGDAQGDEEKIRAIVQVPLEIVRGNCDIYSHLFDYRLLDLNTHRIYMTHGHLEGVRSHCGQLVKRAKSLQADIAIYGHTHVPDCHKKDDVLVINPGSLTYPRGEIHIPTYGILTIDEKQEVSCHIYDVSKRLVL